MAIAAVGGEGEPPATSGHYLSRIWRGLARVGDARLRPLGLATAQLPVLAVLRNAAPVNQRDLARMVKVEQPTMAQLLRRMQRDGLIERHPDPSDARSSIVSLSGKAVTLWPRGEDVLRGTNAELMRGFNKEEVETLVGLLRRMLDNVDAM